MILEHIQTDAVKLIRLNEEMGQTVDKAALVVHETHVVQNHGTENFGIVSMMVFVLVMGIDNQGTII
jgi:hypothetical protein